MRDKRLYGISRKETSKMLSLTNCKGVYRIQCKNPEIEVIAQLLPVVKHVNVMLSILFRCWRTIVQNEFEHGF